MVEAAFLPVVFRAQDSGMELTTGMLGKSVENLDALFVDIVDEQLPSTLRTAMAARLETLPGVQMSRRRQTQTAYNQFLYNTMHVSWRLDELSVMPG